VFGFVGSGKKKNPERKTEYRGNQEESNGEQLGFGFFGYGGRREKEKSCYRTEIVQEQANRVTRKREKKRKKRRRRRIRVRSKRGGNSRGVFSM
jgi:hypothetical protein